MICPKCKSDGIKNFANGIPFYYCKTCKEEIIEENDNILGNPYTQWTEQDMDDLMEFIKGNDDTFSFYPYDDEEDDTSDFTDKWGMVWGD